MKHRKPVFDLELLEPRILLSGDPLLGALQSAVPNDPDQDRNGLESAEEVVVEETSLEQLHVEESPVLTDSGDEKPSPKTGETEGGDSMTSWAEGNASLTAPFEDDGNLVYGEDSHGSFSGECPSDYVFSEVNGMLWKTAGARHPPCWVRWERGRNSALSFPMWKAA